MKEDTMTETPRTATGRKLLDTPDVLLMMDSEEIIGINEGELELHVLAIEAEAAQDATRQRDELREALARLEKAAWNFATNLGGLWDYRDTTDLEHPHIREIVAAVDQARAILRATEGKQP